MKKNKEKYIVYCRKSSEGEDKQVLSVQSQEKELRALAKRLGITPIRIYKESKSAKAPGRPVFSEMIKKLYEEDIKGVLCWKLDRLARNPIDGGNIIWLVKDNGIKIITPSQTYSQESENTLLMYVEFGMAQRYIDDLGKNVRRGLNFKAEQGHYPAHAPLGFKNTPSRKKGFKIIKKDKDRFPLVRKIFKEILRGKQPIKVWRIARDEWKLTTKKGVPIPRSSFYRLLTNPFYCGTYEWPRNSGNWFKGRHTPLISEQEYDLVQKMLGNKGKPRPQKHIFDFTGVFECETCGCMYTATKKVKHYKTTGNTRTYVYYHCSRKNPDIKCKEHPITKEDLEEQVYNLLGRIEIPKSFQIWAKKWLKELHNIEVVDRVSIFKSQQKAFNKIQIKLDRLLDSHIDGLVDKSVYKKKKNELLKERKYLKERLEDTEYRADDWHKKAENIIDLTYDLKNKFSKVSPDEKKELLKLIGSNYSINNKKISITLEKPLLILSEREKLEEKNNVSLEPHKYDELLRKNEDLRPQNLVWLPG